MIGKAEVALAPRWKRAALPLTVAILVVGAIWLVTGLRESAFLGGDRLIYVDRVNDFLAGRGFYLSRQLAGPYIIAAGDSLYPPVALWLFVPTLNLSPILFVALPAAVIGWSIWRLRPPRWSWPLIAVCIAWPWTLEAILFANPVLWFAALVALGTVYEWPSVFAIVKLSLAPFAFIGMTSRSWWIGLAALGVASVPFGAMWIDYARAIVYSNASFAYNVAQAPVMALPVIAWLSSERDDIRRGAASRSAATA